MAAAASTDVRDMRIVHETFRRAYAESAALVRASPTPSSARTTFLADHIDFGLTMLHGHHESEDLLLYPLLVQRAPEQAAQTESIEHEHVAVGTALEDARSACAAWRSAPSVGTAEALATALEHLNEVTQPHLDHEEQVIVPLAAQHLTQAEWDALGEHSRAGIPRHLMGVALGMITEPLDAEDAAFMRSHLPAPVRLLYPLLIERPWRKYAATLRHGT